LNNTNNIQGIGMTSQRTRDRLIRRLEEQGINDPRVLKAIRETPRHLFVDEALASRVYEDTALPIESGQTISQPYVVARMTELIIQKPVSRVLEVGTGSGYQAAVLAQLVTSVYTVERIHGLFSRAQERFKRLGYQNIRCKFSDGNWGWPSQAPFDAIIVTAAPSVVPDELLEQLKMGGRMVVPVGNSRGVQQLLLITCTKKGFEQRSVESVSFVPLLEGTEQ
jgi:protein-L-isoaspartate(D-aspartate) O-methyltransferase